jgi:hypothetical protein
MIAPLVIVAPDLSVQPEAIQNSSGLLKFPSGILNFFASHYVL